MKKPIIKLTIQFSDLESAKKCQKDIIANYSEDVFSAIVTEETIV
jgi:hypothetical protein